MKKILLILLINLTCYGNLPVKESLFKRACDCLCPCFMGHHRQEYRHTNSSLRRIANSHNLKHMESPVSPDSPIDNREHKDYMDIEKKMVEGLEQKIKEKEQEIATKIEIIKNRNGLNVPVE